MWFEGIFMKYFKVKSIKNANTDLFIENCNLFAIFDAPVNVLFADNFINNIKKYKDIFAAYNMHDNIFFSCKANKSVGFLRIASDNGCGIEVSSEYELADALKFTKKIIASGPAKSDKYLKMSIENNSIISVDDIEELKNILKFDLPVNVFIRINNHGVRIYSQFPLLRGINDNPLVLEKLLLLMDELHIRPLSIFIAYPISYGASFRVGFKRIIKIIDDINWNAPSWINSIRFALDTTIGKVRRENIIKWENNYITFSRDNNYVIYHDIPDNIDIAGDINRMLWKGQDTSC
jgi:hypothetical protein